MQEYFLNLCRNKEDKALSLGFHKSLLLWDSQQMNLLGLGQTFPRHTWMIYYQQSPSGRWETHTVCIFEAISKSYSNKMQMKSSKRIQAHFIRKSKSL